MIGDKEEVPQCRYCGKSLKGGMYYTGKSAYHPETGERCKANFYGGWICSKSCDYNASMEMESSMPGAGRATRLGSSAERHYKSNWSDE